MTDENSNGESKNPYVGRGLILTTNEYELASQALTMLGEIAEKENEHLVKRRCHQLIHRMTQVMHAGEGMTPESAQRYGARIANAMQAAAVGHPEADTELVQAVGMLIAASVRLDADPADKIGLMLSQLVRTASHEGSRVVAVMFLRDLTGILEDAHAGWTADGWPAPVETLQWVSEVVKTGVDNIEAGLDPWSQGDDEAPAPAAAAEEPAPVEEPAPQESSDATP